jgi:hypothetical protein
LLFSASLFSVLTLRLLVLAIRRIDEISKKVCGERGNNGRQRDSQLRFYYIIIRVVRVRYVLHLY